MLSHRAHMVTTITALVIGSTACESQADRPPIVEAPPAAASHGEMHAAPLSAAVRSQVRELKARMAKYQSFERAKKDGYDTAITGCLDNPPVGGMGVHYGKTTIIDGQVSPLTPEVLLYEPVAGGRPKFVGVEFIVPFTAWSSPTPPVLFGQTFMPNATFQVWALHVWVGRENPQGVFVDWNPRVKC